MQRITTTTSRLVRRLLNVALVAVTLACAAYLLPSVLGFERYVITGGSMTGSIDKGSVAFEKPRAVEDLKVGDVITYLPPAQSGVDNLVTHRIIELTDNDQGAKVLRTKGDANSAADPWTFSLVASEQPVVDFSVPRVGYVLIALADRETRMLAIGGPASLVALLSLVELVKALGGTTPGHRRGTPTAQPVAVASTAPVAAP